MICTFLVLVFLSVGALTAPTRELEENENETDIVNLKMIFLEGLRSDTNNLEKVKAAFKVKPGSVKICVPLTYNIICTDQIFDPYDGYCSNNYTPTFIWTAFDGNSISGLFLFSYASGNLNIIGFEWGGACDVYTNLTEFKLDPILNLTITSLPCMDRDTYNIILSKLTEMVSIIL